MSGQPANIPKLGLFLGAVAAVAAGLLSSVHSATRPAIGRKLQEKTNAALRQVLPPFDNAPGEETVKIDSAEGWPVVFYIARRGCKVVGYAGEAASPDGFAGDVSVMAGLELDGTIRTVIVTASSETPGLGTAVTDRKIRKTLAGLLKGATAAEGLPPNPFLDWYAGRQAGGERWGIVKEGEAVNGKTGATITSRAVCGAVHAIGRTCRDHLDELKDGATPWAP